MRTIRFMVCEAIAIAVGVASSLAATSVRFAGESLTPAFRVIPITAATVAVILPICSSGIRDDGIVAGLALKKGRLTIR